MFNEIITKMKKNVLEDLSKLHSYSSSYMFAINYL